MQVKVAHPEAKERQVAKYVAVATIRFPTEMYDALQEVIARRELNSYVVEAVRRRMEQDGIAPPATKEGKRSR